MTSNRYTCSSALGILVGCVAPFWALACSAESSPQSTNEATTETTSTSGATTTTGTPTVGGMGTSGPTGSSATSAASTSGASSVSTTSSNTSSTSGAAGVGGSGGVGTTNAGNDTTGTTAGGGGSGGTGGTGPVGTGDPDPSPGCGMMDPTDCLPCMSNDRPYYVDMPNDYDPNHPYPVIFRYHPLGGTAEGARNMYLGPNDFEAIYVSPEGSDNGFPNQGGADEQMTRDIMTDIEARLCVDRARYYATGFSYGGSMSYTAACNMSDKFRAVAAMAGATVSGARCANEEPERPVAVLGIHGEEDTVLPITLAEPIIGAMLEKNGCSGDAPQSSDIIDPECVKMTSARDAGSYQGCMDGYPVIWCPIPGYPHNIPMWSRGAIAKFFALF